MSTLFNHTSLSKSVTLDKLVGNTPLVEIRHSRSNKVKILAKCEWFNPSGSIKDRVAFSLIKFALDNDLLLNKILIDATSGNTGVSLAMMGAMFQVPVELAIPENAPKETKLLIQNYGAKLHLTSPESGTDGAQDYVEKLVQEYSQNYYYPNQYNNPITWEAHVSSTAPEIWLQSEKKITHFIAGIGTSGTFMGVSKFLKPKGVSCICVQPNNSRHGIYGWKHLKGERVPGIYDKYLADSHIEISTKKAFSYARSAFCHLGLCLSPSSAANLVAAVELSKSLDEGVIVTIFPDDASRYLQELFWKDSSFVIENPFF